MANFDFTRDSNGNYQASVGNTYTRVTIKTFADNIYVDIRDYFTKDSTILPTRRGVTLTKTEWQQLCDHAEQLGTAVAQILDELAANQIPTQQPDITIAKSPGVELKQSIRLYDSISTFGPHQSVRVVLSKYKYDDNKAKAREILFKPIHWYNIVIRNREQINMLIEMLEKEASLSVDKRKQDTLAAERSLFQATWSLPSLR
jgi:hypothetical protein